jgi:diguanylate cyclase
VTPSRASVEHDLAIAMRDLALLREQVATANANFAALSASVATDGLPLTAAPSPELMLANEQLVLNSLHDRSQVESVRAVLEDVRRQGELDELTHLPHRGHFMACMTQAIAHARDHGARLAVLFIDLDQFKCVNDRLGHAIGDEVLKITAQRLSAAVRNKDCVGRHGGDEFVVVLTDVQELGDAQRRANAVMELLASPYVVLDHSLQLRASVGISFYPDDGEDAAALLDHADMAMYRSKRAGSMMYPSPELVDTSGTPMDRVALDDTARQRAQSHLIASGQVRRHEDLREANERLVLAALGAQQLQASAELAHRRQKELLAVVAHELRTPLTPMRMAAGLLGDLRADLLPQLKSIIEREVRHMSRLIGDLLDMSRVHAGKLRLECRSIDLSAVIAESIDACRPTMDDRRQALHLHLAEGPVMLHGDAVRLAQVLRNLLDNASKYTPVGGRIDLGLRRLKRRVVITVCDTGIGIRAEALPHVFDPFVQDPHAVGFNGAGLGIGLTVVRELVEGHGGRVVARSDGGGQGSQFIVTLPRSAHPGSAVPA